MQAQHVDEGNRNHRNDGARDFLRPVDIAEKLKNLLWNEFELSRIAAGWIPAISLYEHKVKFGRFSYLHNQHMKQLHERINELRGGLGDHDWIPELTEEAFDRLALAPDYPCFLAGYHIAVQAQYKQYDHLLTVMDPILDAPTYDIIRKILINRDELTLWLQGELRFASLDSGKRAEPFVQWERYAYQIWEIYQQATVSGKPSADTKWPSHPTEHPAGPVPDEPVLEDRFPIYDLKKPSQIYSDPEMSPLHNNTRQMMFIHANEIGPAVSLAYLYYGVVRMPLPFYYDLSRHMWDEFRHSQMGMRRLQQFGFKTEDFQWFKAKPLKGDIKSCFADMYSHLTMVGESCSFSKKRKAAETFWKFGDALSAVQMEYDITDERMHVDFGNKWGPELYKLIGEVVTAKTMARKARERRLKDLDVVTAEEFDKIVDYFPAFCDLHRSSLNLENY